MRTLIKSLELSNETVKLYLEDNARYVLEKSYKGTKTVACDFPLSMVDEALRFYTVLSNDLIDDFDASPIGSTGMVH